MSDRADFLVELGTEELPPKALLALSDESSPQALTNMTSEANTASVHRDRVPGLI